MLHFGASRRPSEGQHSDRHCRALLAAGTSRPPPHSCYLRRCCPVPNMGPEHHAARFIFCPALPSMPTQAWQHPAEAESPKCAPNRSHVQILEVPGVLHLSLHSFSIKTWPFFFYTSRLKNNERERARQPENEAFLPPPRQYFITANTCHANSPGRNRRFVELPRQQRRHHRKQNNLHEQKSHAAAQPTEHMFACFGGI